jgi:hypothetical protein
MKYFVVAFIVVSFITIFNSCSWGLKQSDCMTEGRLLYKGNCVLFESIPEEDQDKIIQKVADEKGISFDEAYILVSQ